MFHLTISEIDETGAGKERFEPVSETDFNAAPPMSLPVKRIAEH